jgi:hypothetical protein
MSTQISSRMSKCIYGKILKSNGNRRNTLSLQCANEYNQKRTIFQFQPSSEQVSLIEIKHMLDSTSDMTYVQKMRIFQEKGLHYERTKQYYNIIVSLENTFTQSTSNASTIFISEEKNISDDLAMYIQEASKEKYDDRNDYNNNIALTVSDDFWHLKHLERKGVDILRYISGSITITFTMLLIIKIIIDKKWIG